MGSPAIMYVTSPAIIDPLMSIRISDIMISRTLMQVMLAAAAHRPTYSGALAPKLQVM